MRLGGIPTLLAALAILAVPVLAKDTSAPQESPAPKEVPVEKEAPAENDTLTGPHSTFTIPSLDHDFGSLKPGTPIEYRFEFRNEGDADLVIQSVKASCGCTTASYDTLVAPGKTGGVLLAIKKTDTYNGKISKGATVLTNDPEHEKVRLTLRADFTPK